MEFDYCFNILTVLKNNLNKKTNVKLITVCIGNKTMLLYIVIEEFHFEVSL